MAKVKNSVDYFSHDCRTGKTVFILEQRYGNDGYAAWFKLLEMLGTADGHCLDLNDLPTLQYVVARLRMTEEQCIEIINLLATLGAVDPELWAAKVIWSQNFVDRLEAVYVRRRAIMPDKPALCEQNGQPSGHNVNIMRQSKVKESKVKNIYEETVKLTDEEHAKLVQQFGEPGTKERIISLNLYKLSTGRNYKSDYATILAWERMKPKPGRTGPADLGRYPKAEM